jgi:hypothetical protein
MEGRFPLGRIVGTPGAIDALERAGQVPQEFLARHHAGDWGDVGAADRKRTLTRWSTTCGSCRYTPHGEERRYG